MSYLHDHKLKFALQGNSQNTLNKSSFDSLALKKAGSRLEIINMKSGENGGDEDVILGENSVRKDEIIQTQKY